MRLGSMRRGDERGVALFSVLMMIFVLAILGAAVVAGVNNDLLMAANQRNGTRALYIAEAGIERAIAERKTNPTWPGASDAAFAGGVYDVVVTRDVPQAGWVRIRSTGFYPSKAAARGRRIIEVEMQPTGGGPPVGVFADELVQLDNNGGIDSYNGALTGRNLSRVATNGSLTLSNGGSLKGTATYGSGAGDTLTGGSSITCPAGSGAACTSRPNPEYGWPPIPASEYQAAFTAARTSNNNSSITNCSGGPSGAVGTSGGQPTFNLTSGSACFPPGVYYFNTFRVDQGSVRLTGSGEVKIYVRMSFLVDNDARVNCPSSPCNTSGVASNLRIFFGDGVNPVSAGHEVNINNKVVVVAAIYAPLDGIRVQNGSTLWGAAAGKRLRVDNSGARLRYDETFSGFGSAGGVRMNSWREVLI